MFVCRMLRIQKKKNQAFGEKLWNGAYMIQNIVHPPERAHPLFSPKTPAFYSISSERRYRGDNKALSL